MGGASFNCCAPVGTKILLYFKSNHDAPAPLIFVDEQCRHVIFLNKQAMRFAVFDHSDASIVSVLGPSIDFSDGVHLEKRLLTLPTPGDNLH